MTYKCGAHDCMAKVSNMGEYCPEHKSKCPVCKMPTGKCKCPKQEKKSAAEKVSAVMDQKFGARMADSFLNELEKISLVSAPEPVVDGGPGQAGPGPVEHFLGQQMATERKAEEAKSVGNPAADRLQVASENVQRKGNTMAVAQKNKGGMVSGLLQRLRLRKAASLLKTSAVSKITHSKYFQHKMRERGITSEKQLTPEEKKKFYDEVDTGWHSSHEKAKGLSAREG